MSNEERRGQDTEQGVDEVDNQSRAMLEGYEMAEQIAARGRVVATALISEQLLAAGFQVGDAFRLVSMEDGNVWIQPLPEYDWKATPQDCVPLPCPVCGVDGCDWMSARMQGQPLDHHPRTISGSVRTPEALGPHLLMGDTVTGGIKPVPLFDNPISQGREIQRRLIRASARSASGGDRLTVWKGSKPPSLVNEAMPRE